MAKLCALKKCDGEDYRRGMCRPHYTSWLTYGDPLTARRYRPRGKKSIKPITVTSLKDLSLYNAFDISLWCAKNKVQSVYLEYQPERIMQVEWEHFSRPCWVVKDAAQPGKIIKRFLQDGDTSLTETRKRAEAWVEAVYDTPMKFLRVMGASFPEPAVDQILYELEIMRKVWSPEPTVRAEVPKEESTRFLAEHPVPPKSIRKKVLV